MKLCTRDMYFFVSYHFNHSETIKDGKRSFPDTAGRSTSGLKQHSVGQHYQVALLNHFDINFVPTVYLLHTMVKAAHI